MKPTVCVSFEVPHGPTGSPCCQNRNRILSRAARLRKPNTKRVRNGRNGARSDVSGPRINGFLSRLDSCVGGGGERSGSEKAFGSRTWGQEVWRSSGKVPPPPQRERKMKSEKAQSFLKSADVIVNEGQVINRVKVFTLSQMPPLRTAVSGGLRSRRRLSPAVRPH